MTRWTHFIEWCRKPSKIKIRTFNPRNITVFSFSILLVSLLTSGPWLFQVFSISQNTPIIASICGDGTKIAFTVNVNGDNEIFVIINDIPMPLPTPEAGFSFPIEYAAAGIVAVTVAVVIVIILFVRKK